MAENLTPDSKGFYKNKELDPLTMRSLEKVVKTWDTLKAMDDKHNIERLRIRADLAEQIRDALTAGATKVLVAKRLGIDPTRVTRLVQGNYNFGPSSVHRKGKFPNKMPVLTFQDAKPVLAWLEKNQPTVPVPEYIKKAKGNPGCKYCGGEACYAVDLPNRSTFYVCERHKPPE